MAVSPENRVRYRVMMIAREAKAIFAGPPERWAKALAARFFVRWIARWLFLGPEGTVHRGGEIVLAFLRTEAGLDRPTLFHSDPHVLAYRQGQRDLYLALVNLLNLDESSVRLLMELDDGLE